MTGMSFSELLRFDEEETEHWRHFLQKLGPEALDLPVELAGRTVRELLLHIFSVELKYGERLAEAALTAPDQLRADSLDHLFAIGETARRHLRGLLQSASESDLQATITFPTVSAGQQTASKRKVLAHALLHSLRHWAQLTTEMRKRGHKTDWHHDFLFSDAMK
jgi:uncharacterized damage-inducible protein DinB